MCFWWNLSLIFPNTVASSFTVQFILSETEAALFYIPGSRLCPEILACIILNVYGWFVTFVCIFLNNLHNRYDEEYNPKMGYAPLKMIAVTKAHFITRSLLLMNLEIEPVKCLSSRISARIS